MTPQIWLISNPAKPTHRRLSFKNDMTTFEKGLGWVAKLVNGDAIALPVRESGFFSREAMAAHSDHQPVKTDAWPCEIMEADFEQNTITLNMQCSDYKVSAGRHWLSTTPQPKQEQDGNP